MRWRFFTEMTFFAALFGFLPGLSAAPAAPPGTEDFTVFRLGASAGAPFVRSGWDLDPKPYERFNAPLFNCFNAAPAFAPGVVWTSGYVDGYSGPGLLLRSDAFRDPKALKGSFWRGASLDVFVPQSSGGLRHEGPFEILDSESAGSFLARVVGASPFPSGLRGSRYTLSLRNSARRPDAADGLAALLLENPAPACASTSAKAVSWRIEPSGLGPADAESSSALLLDVSQASMKAPQGLRQRIPPVKTLKELLPAKASYKIRLLCKGEPSKNALFKLDVGGCSSFDFQAPPVWTERIFEVKASDLAKPFPKGGSGEDGWLSLLACAPARLQVAALALYRDDCAPFSMLPEWRSALTSLQPGALRLWSAYSCKDSLSLLSEAAFASPCFDMVRDSGSPQLTLPDSLRLCVECGAVPWLLLDPLRPPGFFQELAEYLGAPPDVGFGRLRSAQGRPKPWTADIPAFVVEFAYEPWSKSCAPLDWRSSPEDFVDAALYAKGVLSGNPYLKNVRFAMPGDAASQGRGSWTFKAAAAAPSGAFASSRAFQTGGSDGYAYAPKEPADVMPSRLLHPSVSLGRRMALLSLLEPDDGGLALLSALERDETLFALCVPYLWPRGSRNSFPDEIFKRAFEPVELSSLGRLFSADADASSLPDLSPLAAAFDRAFALLFWRAIPDSGPDAAEMASLLCLKPAELSDFAAALANCDGRRAASMMKADPKFAAAVSSLLAAAHLEKHLFKMKSGASPGAGQLDDIAVKLASRFVENSGAKAALASRLLAVLGQGDFSDAARPLSDASGDFLLSCAVRRADLLAAAMRKKPAFARVVLRTCLRQRAAFDGQFSVSTGAREFQLAALAAKLSKTSVSNIPRDFAAPFNMGLLGCLAGMRPEPQALFAAGLLASGGEASDSVKARFDAAIPALCVRLLADSLVMRMANDANIAASFQRVLPHAEPRPFVYEFGPLYEAGSFSRSFITAQDFVNRSFPVSLAVLDTSFLALQSGFSFRSFYRFGSGDGYSSHIADPGRAALAPKENFATTLLRLAGERLSGRAVDVCGVSVRRVDIPDSEGSVDCFDGSRRKLRLQGRGSIPLEDCWAFKDGDRFSALLLNRSFEAARQLVLEGVHPKNGGIQALLADFSSASASLRERKSRLDVSDGRACVLLPPCSALFLNWRE